LLNEQGTKKRKSTHPLDGGTANDREKFWLAFNMFKHPPVFKFTSLSDSAEVNLGLLRNIELPPIKKSVIQLLEFDAFEDVTVLGDLKKFLYIEGDIYIRSIRPLLPICQPIITVGVHS
jgi:hypothetical protein